MIARADSLLKPDKRPTQWIQSGFSRSKTDGRDYNIHTYRSIKLNIQIDR